MKKFFKLILPIMDILLVPFIFFPAFLLKLLKKAGLQRMPFCKFVLLRVGVFPIRNHYYEPFFDHRTLRQPLNQDRVLPGIHWNIDEQLELLKKFNFNEELESLTSEKIDGMVFNFNNGSFGSGDSEFLYNLIRLKKPNKIFEIGSGNSTLIALKAVQKNINESPDYKCQHICIEPYEMPWLENTGVSVVRKRVEDVGKEFFSTLESGDLLFIDSSHVIRTQGDVLFEYLELLPSLKKGVIVHIHDIFSPKDYLSEWIIDQGKLWNEQYLLEAFLTHNQNWKIIGALNFLHHNYFEYLQGKCPFLKQSREPGSFYIEKIV